MTNTFRLKWEPEGLAPQELISRQVMKYMDNEATFAQFSAGTCLILKPVDDLTATIEGAMRESRRIADFKVYPMLDGDFLVFFASSLLVYVGQEEFATMRESIVADLDNLKFPSEVISAAAAPLRPDDVLVGLYARGKLQCDAWRETGYIIVSPEAKTPSLS